MTDDIQKSSLVLTIQGMVMTAIGIAGFASSAMTEKEENKLYSSLTILLLFTFVWSIGSLFPSLVGRGQCQTKAYSRILFSIISLSLLVPASLYMHALFYMKTESKEGKIKNRKFLFRIANIISLLAGIIYFIVLLLNKEKHNKNSPQ